MFNAAEFAAKGALKHCGHAAPVLGDLLEALKLLPSDKAGIRLRDIPCLTALIGEGSIIGEVAEHAIGPLAKPVRALLFDKSPTANWSLGRHQDRTICVRERIETPGYGPWTVKQGITHVAPPIGLLQQMVTVRVHLDDVPDDNAPLLIAPGSHRFGRILEQDIASIVQKCGTLACTARAGDIWLYSTPILHASEAALEPRRRRVLQIDYTGASLPNGLVWAGI